MPDLNWAKLNLKKLINGRLDAFFDRQQYTIPYVAINIRILHKIKILYAPEPADPFYIVFSKTVKNNSVVIKKFNHVLTSEDLEYEQLLKEEFARIQ